MKKRNKEQIIRVKIIGDIGVQEALDYCKQVAGLGRISWKGGQSQPCFHSSFYGGIEVAVDLKKSGVEVFTVYKEGGKV